MPLASCFCQLERSSGVRPFPFSWLGFRGRREGYAAAPPPPPFLQSLKTKQNTSSPRCGFDCTHMWTRSSSVDPHCLKSPHWTAPSYLDPAKTLLSTSCQPTSLLACRTRQLLRLSLLLLLASPCSYIYNHLSVLTPTHLSSSPPSCSRWESLLLLCLAATRPLYCLENAGPDSDSEQGHDGLTFYSAL